MKSIQKHLQQRHRQNLLRSFIFEKAFTLVELLVVISIISALAALLMPALNRIQETGRRTVCMNNVRQIGLAFKTYATENHGVFPGTDPDGRYAENSNGVFKQLADEKYLEVKGSKTFICPSSTKKVTPNAFLEKNNSYSCTVEAPHEGLSENVPSDTPLIYDEGVQQGSVLATNGDKITASRDAFWAEAHGPHKSAGGNIFYVGGNAGFEKKFRMTATPSHNEPDIVGVFRVPGDL